MNEFKNQIEQWEKINLDSRGVYIGVPMRFYQYKRGDYVPVNARYSAMLAWKYLAGNNPANPEHAKHIKA